MGNATGGTEIEMGTTTSKECCVDLVRKTEPNATGVTWGGGKCYAKFGATGVDGSDKLQSCLFKGQ